MTTMADTEPATAGISRGVLRLALGVIGSGALIAAYAQGSFAWLFGLVMLVPWLWALERSASVRATLAAGVLMSMAYQLAAIGWFGVAFGDYVGLGALPASLILLVAAPLLQPQFVVFAWVRRRLATRSPILRAIAAASAWVATEWLFPKLLGDTLGHGLQPAMLLRQAADLGGAAGLTVLLLLGNECVAAALGGGRAAWRPLALGACLWAATAAYGMARLSQLQSYWTSPAPALRVGLVQANLTDLERRRAEHGAYATVRELLEVQLGMSEQAVREQGAQALLWSETVYPTTFGHPKSDDGAALDRELAERVARLGVPLAFGTYDRDAGGEYNSAAFLDPVRGLLGHYRKTHLFPWTERVPPWVDGPLLRQWLPWTGTWQPGDGARVFPLRAADGVEAPVLPLICLDDVRPQLALDGARLGAQAIVGLSNDSWFTAHPAGARLHLTVASFRSIETRLPQLRVTTNGYSALVDESGEILVHTEMGQRAVLVGEIPLRDPAATLMVRWGDWVGPVALAILLLVLLQEAGGRLLWPARRTVDRPLAPEVWASPVVVLSATSQRVLRALNLVALAGLTWLVVRMAGRDGWQVNSIDQVRIFGWIVVSSLLLAWVIRHVNAGVARVADGALRVEGGFGRIDLPLAAIHRLRVERPAAERATLVLSDAAGAALPQRLEIADAPRLREVLQAAGATVEFADDASAARAERVARRASVRSGWLDHGAIRFALYPLLLALPAYRLHQMITFGSTFGEAQVYGASAWLGGLLIWWAAWSLGSMLLAALLRGTIESVAVIVERTRPTAAARTRRVIEGLGRAVFFVGPPLWLALKAFWG